MQEINIRININHERKIIRLRNQVKKYEKQLWEMHVEPATNNEIKFKSFNGENMDGLRKSMEEIRKDI
eukprot:Pgem_evm1s17948